MPIRRSAETTPDLFSERAPEPLAKANMAAQPRHFLPKDLAGALKRLDNAEIDALVVAVTTEAERRGRLPPSRPKTDARPQARQAPAERRRFVEHGQAERSARRFQGWRQAFRDCATIWDFTVRYQDGARRRSRGPKIWSLRRRGWREREV